MNVRELIEWLQANAQPDDVVKCIEMVSGRPWGFESYSPRFEVVEEYKHLTHHDGEVWIGDK